MKMGIQTQLILKKEQLPKSSLIINELANQMLKIFTKHVGAENAISKEKLFKLIFGHYYQAEDLKDYLLWDFTRRALTLLRTRSNCFVVSRNMGSDYFFWVLKEKSDAEYYVNMLDKNVKKIRNMQARAITAYEEKWYKNNWTIEHKQIKQLRKYKK